MREDEKQRKNKARFDCSTGKNNSRQSPVCSLGSIGPCLRVDNVLLKYGNELTQLMRGKHQEHVELYKHSSKRELHMHTLSRSDSAARRNPASRSILPCVDAPEEPRNAVVSVAVPPREGGRGWAMDVGRCDATDDRSARKVEVASMAGEYSGCGGSVSAPPRVRMISRSSRSFKSRVSRRAITPYIE